MRLIREEVVAPAALTSNVAITETAWTPGTYTLGQQRYIGTDLYEVVADPSTADDPRVGVLPKPVPPVNGEAQPDLPPTWVRIGKINRWRMFSEFVAEKTVRASPLQVEIATSPRVNAVALFGLEAAAVEIVTYSGGEETGRVSKAMTNVMEVSNWYEYFFQEIIKIEEGVILDLPSYGTDRLVIRVTNDDAPVAIGKVVIGQQVELGKTRLGYSAGIEDFSLKERDDFGGWKVTERRFAKRAEFSVILNAGRFAAVMRDLAAVRARPTVFIGDPASPETIVIGFYKDAWATRSTREIAEMTLEIEGLT